MAEVATTQPVVPATGKQEQTAPAAESSNRSQSDLKKEKARGVVKSVLSGDTIVILVQDKNHRGPPSERIVTLSNVQAPKLGRKKHDTQDEPFAWASREFLRKKIIGKPVSYSIEFRPASSSGYGAVYLISEGQQEDIAKILATAGWATVKRPTREDAQIRPELQELIRLEDAAKEAGKGVHGSEDWPRNLATAEETELFTKLKGAPQSGIIEQVFSGSSFRVLVPLGKEHYEITLHLSGVRSPDVRVEGTVPPFTREAKFFSEHYLLNRDVSIIFEGVDKRVFYGSISYAGHNISEELLANGLAEYVDWSARRTSFQDKLRAAEAAAKEKRIRIWSSYVEPKALTSKEERKQLKPGKEIVGKVVDVVSAGAVVIQDNNNTKHRVFLSSIKVPRQGSLVPQDRETKQEAYDNSVAFEGKEFLRKRVISQRVRVVIDYLRSEPPRGGKNQTAAEKEPSPDKVYASLYLDKNNVAVELVEQGYARAAEHRAGEPRSRDYEHILLAEQRAQKLQRGVHTPIEKATVLHFTDVTLDTSKSKNLLPFLKRGGKLRGVVEYEFSGSKLKVYIPKENCIFLFLSRDSVLPLAEMLLLMKLSHILRTSSINKMLSLMSAVLTREETSCPMCTSRYRMLPLV
jgi:staphylococcal nuclease domain-containing protein 1